MDDSPHSPTPVIGLLSALPEKRDRLGLLRILGDDVADFGHGCLDVGYFEKGFDLACEVGDFGWRERGWKGCEGADGDRGEILGEVDVSDKRLQREEGDRKTDGECLDGREPAESRGSRQFAVRVHES